MTEESPTPRRCILIRASERRGDLGFAEPAVPAHAGVGSPDADSGCCRSPRPAPAGHHAQPVPRRVLDQNGHEFTGRVAVEPPVHLPHHPRHHGRVNVRKPGRKTLRDMVDSDAFTVGNHDPDPGRPDPGPSIGHPVKHPTPKPGSDHTATSGQVTPRHPRQQPSPARMGSPEEALPTRPFHCAQNVDNHVAGVVGNTTIEAKPGLVVKESVRGPSKHHAVAVLVSATTRPFNLRAVGSSTTLLDSTSLDRCEVPPPGGDGSGGSPRGEEPTTALTNPHGRGRFPGSSTTRNCPAQWRCAVVARSCPHIAAYWLSALTSRLMSSSTLPVLGSSRSASLSDSSALVRPS